MKLPKKSRQINCNIISFHKNINFHFSASAEKGKRGIADKLSPPANKKPMFSSLSPIKGGNGFAAEQAATEGDAN